MAIDGFLVAGQCVVSPSGIEAINTYLALVSGNIVNSSGGHLLVIDANLPQVIPQAPPASLAVSVAIFDISTGLDTSLPVNVMLRSCDSSAFPTTSLGYLTPDVPTAITLVVAIWLVWTVGFGIRALIKTLHTNDNDVSGD